MHKVTIRGLLFIISLCASCMILPASSAENEKSTLQRAMEDELQRSMQELRLGNLAKPYFIAYKIDEWDLYDASASLGALLNSSKRQQRLLTVEVRVGDYQADNSNFSANSTRFSLSRLSASTAITLDDNYAEIRRQIWLLTDTVYKSALEDFAQKNAALQDQQAEKSLPDLSHEETINNNHVGLPLLSATQISAAQMEATVRETSEVLRDLPQLVNAQAQYLIANTKTWFLNSEGTWFVRTQPITAFRIEATVRAEKTKHVHDFFARYGATPAEIPKLEDLKTQALQLRDRLQAARTAQPLRESYFGPVLFEDQAAAELLLQALAPALIGNRLAVDTEKTLSRQQQLILNRGFNNRIGSKVLPEFLSVRDDPTLKKFNGQTLNGHYLIDDQGVTARNKLLVDKGVLKTLLVDRGSSIAGVERSSGNARDGQLIVPSNLIIEVERSTAKNKTGLSNAALLKLLRQKIKDDQKEFGVIVRRIDTSRGATPPSGDRSAIQIHPLIGAYKVYVDGREEQLKDVEIADFTLASFKNIIAAGSNQTIYSAPFSLTNNPLAALRALTRTMPSTGQRVVSIVTPSFLMTDINITNIGGSVPLPPAYSQPED